MAFANGSMQQITTSVPTVLTLDWAPENTGTNYLRMRLWINVTNVSHLVTFPVSVSVGTAHITGMTNNILTPPAIGNFIYELSTMDGGVTVIIQQLATP